MHYCVLRVCASEGRQWRRAYLVSDGWKEVLLYLYGISITVMKCCYCARTHGQCLDFVSCAPSSTHMYVAKRLIGPGPGAGVCFWPKLHSPRRLIRQGTVQSGVRSLAKHNTDFRSLPIIASGHCQTCSCPFSQTLCATSNSTGSKLFHSNRLTVVCCCPLLLFECCTYYGHFILQKHI